MRECGYLIKVGDGGIERSNILPQVHGLIRYHWDGRSESSGIGVV
jgi:hypothetical protein